MDYFETLDRAKALGREYADNGIAAGETVPDPAPLSGEWAGAILPNDIIRALGADPDTVEDFERDDIVSFWEDGYNSAEWPGHDCGHPECDLGTDPDSEGCWYNLYPSYDDSYDRARWEDTLTETQALAYAEDRRSE